MTGSASRSSWRAWVPGARPSPRVPFESLLAASFYVYAAIALLRGAKVVALLSSSRWHDRLGGAGVLVGLALFYLVAVWFGERFASGPAVGRGAIRRFRSSPMATGGLVLLVVVFGVSLLAPVLSPRDPIEQADPAGARYLAPSWTHPMGTDRLGRDVLSRVLYGSRVSLAIGVFAVSIASLIGLWWGAFSGYFGGWMDEVAMRVVDGLLAFPRLLLALTLVAFFSNSFGLLVLVLAGTGWMSVARLVRAEVLSLKEREFVQAAVASGAKRRHVVWRHLVPNALGPVLVSASLRVGTIILLESYLSFLGLGVQPPAPSWGAMVLEGREVLLSAWWVSLFPGLAIAVAVVACNLVGDGLRDALDVRA